MHRDQFDDYLRELFHELPEHVNYDYRGYILETLDSNFPDWELPPKKRTFPMINAELQKLIAAERKYKREIQELRDLRAKTMAHKTPDPKVLAMIDTELKHYTEKS